DAPARIVAEQEITFSGSGVFGKTELCTSNRCQFGPSACLVSKYDAGVSGWREQAGVVSTLVGQRISIPMPPTSPPSFWAPITKVTPAPGTPLELDTLILIG